MDVDFEEENLRSLQIEEDEGPIRPSSRIRRRIRIESEVSRPNTAQLADTPRIRIDGVSVAYRYRIHTVDAGLDNFPKGESTNYVDSRSVYTLILPNTK
ncbi:hypothetical protein SASPL_102016 [Salvia splendens]|uniref:Uncharacterized protein n=1 Tax=Salvia splendens TaxID=180675 RepID=A0A8X8YR33_SALSN|nr:hypothetical protein SASPL_102016 [Salvia splendens]